jgi:tetratricopeptide (TPR) repeat protein
MTHPVDPAVAQAHADVQDLFRQNPVGDPAVDPAGLAAVCRAARDRLAAMPALDADDPRAWTSYELITADVQTLLGYLREVDVASSEPQRFRSLLVSVLWYLYRTDKNEPGAYVAEIVHRDWEARIGEAHADTLTAAERLSACLHARGDVEQSLSLLKRVHLLRSRTKGDDDPATLLTASNMGACLNYLDDFQAAFRLNEDTVRRCERRLGEDHRTTILATNNLADTFCGLGQYRNALELYRDIHRRRERGAGENSLAALDAEADIAFALHKLGEYEAARAVNEALLPRFESVAGKDYSGTKRTRNQLGESLRALGREDEADEVQGRMPSSWPHRSR